MVKQRISQTEFHRNPMSVALATVYKKASILIIASNIIPAWLVESEPLLA